MYLRSCTFLTHSAITIFGTNAQTRYYRMAIFDHVHYFKTVSIVYKYFVEYSLAYSYQQENFADMNDLRYVPNVNGKWLECSEMLAAPIQRFQLRKIFILGTDVSAAVNWCIAVAISLISFNHYYIWMLILHIPADQTTGNVRIYLYPSRSSSIRVS